jgi:hypothetical protein
VQRTFCYGQPRELLSRRTPAKLPWNGGSLWVTMGRDGPAVTRASDGARRACSPRAASPVSINSS